MKEYLSGKGSYRQIGRANEISVRSLRSWVREIGITRASYDLWLQRNAQKAEKENEIIAQLIQEYDERFHHIPSYRHKFHSGKELRSAIDPYVHFHNDECFQEQLGVRTPMEVRAAVLHAKNPEQLLIAENKRMQKYKA